MLRSLGRITFRFSRAELHRAVPAAWSWGWGHESGRLAFEELSSILAKNAEFENFVGHGFYDSRSVCDARRRLFSDPLWHLPLRGNQAPFSQGRLELLFHYQEMIKELTEMETAFLPLDCEATAAVEAISASLRFTREESARQSEAFDTVLVDRGVFAATRSAVRTFCWARGLEFVEVDLNPEEIAKHAGRVFAVLVQSPSSRGVVRDLRDAISAANSVGARTVVGADLLACVAFRGPGAIGADLVYGAGQRFGLPASYGPINSAFLAASDQLRRYCRAATVEKIETNHSESFRLAGNFESFQSINAFAGLVNFFYVLGRGAASLAQAAADIEELTLLGKILLEGHGYQLLRETPGPVFGTLCLHHHDAARAARALERQRLAPFVEDGALVLSIDEAQGGKTFKKALAALLASDRKRVLWSISSDEKLNPEDPLRRSSLPFTDLPLFADLQPEDPCISTLLCTAAKRDFVRCLSDLPSGAPPALPELLGESAILFVPKINVHPFAAASLVKGSLSLLKIISEKLLKVCRMDAVTYQPNSTKLAELASLLAVKQFHLEQAQPNRRKFIVLANFDEIDPVQGSEIGLEVIPIILDSQGLVTPSDLAEKIEQSNEELFGIWTNISTLFGPSNSALLKSIHRARELGGKIIVDCEGLLSQLPLLSAQNFPADIITFEPLKAFGLPRQGSGAGVCPVLCKEPLARFLPSHPLHKEPAFTTKGSYSPQGRSLASTPFSSVQALALLFLHIHVFEKQTLQRMSESSADKTKFLFERISRKFDVLTPGIESSPVNRFYINFNNARTELGVSAKNVAMRLSDFGFYPPKILQSFSDIMLIELNHDSPLQEIEELAFAFESISDELNLIKSGEFSKTCNPISEAPHIINDASFFEWNRPYSIERAIFPKRFRVKKEKSDEVDK